MTQHTGIKESDWLGKYWTKWSDAVRAAGYSANEMNQPHALEHLLSHLAGFALELGHFPTQPELNLRRRNDSSCPSPDSIRRRLGRKSNIASHLYSFVKDKDEYESVAAMCVPLMGEKEDVSESKQATDLITGHVYTLRHGNEYKIGRSTDPTRRYKEIKVQMPLDTEEVHVIETDDTVGIEAYWHNRFASKRLNGEWFKLSANDVRDFKKRKMM